MDATTQLKNTLNSHGFKLLGKVVGAVIVVMGVGFIVKSYFELRNNLLEYRIKQYVLYDFKKKYPEEKVSEI